MVVQEFYVRFEPRFSFILAHYFAIPKEMVDLAHRLGEQFNTKQRWWDKDKSWGGGGTDWLHCRCFCVEGVVKVPIDE